MFGAWQALKRIKSFVGEYKCAQPLCRVFFGFHCDNFSVRVLAHLYYM
jgi:hypothetical protein